MAAGAVGGVPSYELDATPERGRSAVGGGEGVLGIGEGTVDESTEAAAMRVQAMARGRLARAEAAESESAALGLGSRI